MELKQGSIVSGSNMASLALPASHRTSVIRADSALTAVIKMTGLLLKCTSADKNQIPAELTPGTHSDRILFLTAHKGITENEIVLINYSRIQKYLSSTVMRFHSLQL
jgi:hypothetical protein